MKEALKKIPILGYLARLSLDLIKLPIVRQDLHNHIISVGSKVDSTTHEIGMVRGQLSSILDNLSRMAAIERELGRTPQAQVSHDASSQLAAPLDLLKGLPEAVRALNREYAESKVSIERVGHQLDLVKASYDALNLRVSDLQESRQTIRQCDDELRDVRQALLLTRIEKLEQRSTAPGRQDGERQLRPSDGNHSSKVAPQILHQDKLVAMAGNLRLNLGCGEIPLDDYFNIDERRIAGVDMVGDAVDLPFEDNSVSEIFTAHLIEHFKEQDLKERVLPSWYRILRPGGLLRVVTPDAEAMIQAWAQGELPWENLRLVTFGSQDYSGNFHYTMFSRESLRRLLDEAGFACQDYSVLGRVNGKCREMELTAIKPVRD